jgi:hypothetical protein
MAAASSVARKRSYRQTFAAMAKLITIIKTPAATAIDRGEYLGLFFFFAIGSAYAKHKQIARRSVGFKNFMVLCKKLVNLRDWC